MAERLFNQTRGFLQCTSTALVDPNDFKAADNFEPGLFFPDKYIWIRRSINTNRLALVLNIVPSSGMTKFNVVLTPHAIAERS